LQRYAKGLAKGGMTLKSIKHYCYPVRAVAKWASLNREQVRDFSLGFRLPKVSHEIQFDEGQGRPFLSLELAATFLLWLREQPNGWRILPGVALQSLCGLRIREALRVSWSKVDFARRTIVVDGVVKNVHSVRRIPVPELVVEVLSSTPHISDRVVDSYDQSHPYGKAVARALKLWSPEAGVEPKGLRRTIPSESVLRGWHRLALERFIGHSPATITDRHYVGGSVSDMEALMRAEIVQKVDELLAQSSEKWQRNGSLATGSETAKPSDSNVLQLPFCA
jgi:integrase